MNYRIHVSQRFTIFTHFLKGIDQTVICTAYWNLVTIKPPILLGIIVLCQIIWTAFYFFFQGKTRWPSFSAELYEWQLSTIVTEWELVRKNVMQMFSFVSHLKNWNIPPFIVTMFNWNCLFYLTGEFCKYVLCSSYTLSTFPTFTHIRKSSWLLKHSFQ